MLINLIPDFIAVLESGDRDAAYQRYVDAHRRVLDAYWESYVLPGGGPGSAHFAEVARAVTRADRADLRAMLARADVVALARAAEARCAELLAPDVDVDVVLMVGVGAANAGELVTRGRGTAFVCVEHFTGVANPETQGLGLDPRLVPLWTAHEYAHCVRYTSPTSRAELRRLVEEDGGDYSYWRTGQRATLRELLVNEGLAVCTARAAAPGHAEWEYFGYTRREYARVRETEHFAARAAAPELDQAGLGLRLRWLSGGTGDAPFPERSGYWLGARMVEPAVDLRGLAWSVRASASELCAAAAAAWAASA